MEVRIEQSWKDRLGEEFDKAYFSELTSFVKDEYRKTKVFPPAKHIFRAFDLCPFDRVKVVIVGQDPYHGDGQAIGRDEATRLGLGRQRFGGNTLAWRQLHGVLGGVRRARTLVVCSCRNF